MENIQKGEIRDNTEEIKSKFCYRTQELTINRKIHRKASMGEISKEDNIFRKSEEEKDLWR